MIEALHYGFMQHALAAGLLASVACGLMGTLVVVNRMVFLAGAVAHAAYGGVGLAFFLGWPVLPCTLGFTVAAGGAMAAVTHQDMEGADTVIGAMWACGMALGILLLDLTPGYNADLMSFLFGSILAVPGPDLVLMAGLDAVALALVLAFRRELMAMAFDREFAASRGVPVAALHFLLLALTAVSVVVVIRVVGLLLVIALFSIPPALAARHVRTMGGMMWAATAYSALFCVAGLALAYALDLTSGASIIAVAGTVYLAVETGSRVRARLGRAG